MALTVPLFTLHRLKADCRPNALLSDAQTSKQEPSLILLAIPTPDQFRLTHVFYKSIWKLDLYYPRSYIPYDFTLQNCSQ